MSVNFGLGGGPPSATAEEQPSPSVGLQALRAQHSLARGLQQLVSSNMADHSPSGYAFTCRETLATNLSLSLTRWALGAITTLRSFGSDQAPDHGHASLHQLLSSLGAGFGEMLGHSSGSMSTIVCFRVCASVIAYRECVRYADRARLGKLLEGLRADGDESRQLEAILEVCDFLRFVASLVA